MYEQVSSAMGDEALATLKKNQDDRVAASATVAANKDQANTKKTKDITALVTTGSEIMTRLEHLGPSEMIRLKIDELHALLVNNDSLGSLPKPNKKTRLEKVNLLPTVQAALGRFLAVAASSVPQAPPLPLIPFAPVIYEGEYIYDLQVEGLLEFFLPISDHVLPYATDVPTDVEFTVAYA